MAVWVAVRPERIRLTRDKPPVPDNCLSGLIVEIGYLGDLSIYQIRVADRSRVTAAIAHTGRAGEWMPQQDEQVWLSFSAEAPIVLTR